MAGMGGIADVVAGISQGKKNVRARRFEDADEARRESAEERRVSAEERAQENHATQATRNRLQKDQEEIALKVEQRRLEEGVYIARDQQAADVGAAQIRASDAARDASNFQRQVAEKNLAIVNRELDILQKRDDSGQTTEEEKLRLEGLKHEAARLKALLKKAEAEQRLAEQEELDAPEDRRLKQVAAEHAQNIQTTQADTAKVIADTAAKRQEIERIAGEENRDIRLIQAKSAEIRAKTEFVIQEALEAGMNNKNAKEQRRLHKQGIQFVVETLLGTRPNPKMARKLYNLHNAGNYEMLEDPVYVGPEDPTPEQYAAAVWKYKIKDLKTGKVTESEYSGYDLSWLLGMSWAGESATNGVANVPVSPGGSSRRSTKATAATVGLDHTKLNQFKEDTVGHIKTFEPTWSPVGKESVWAAQVVHRLADRLNVQGEQLISGQIAALAIDIVKSAMDQGAKDKSFDTEGYINSEIERLVAPPAEPPRDLRYVNRQPPGGGAPGGGVSEVVSPGGGAPGVVTPGGEVLGLDSEIKDFSIVSPEGEVIGPDNPQYQVIRQRNEAENIALEIQASITDNESMGALPEMVTEEAQKEIDALRQTNPGLANEVTNILRDSAGISLRGGSPGSSLEAPVPMEADPRGVAEAPVKWQADDQAKAKAKKLEEAGIYPPGDDGNYGLRDKPSKTPESTSRGFDLQGDSENWFLRWKKSQRGEWDAEHALRTATWAAYQKGLEEQEGDIKKK